MEAAASLNLYTSAEIDGKEALHALACSFDRVLGSNKVKLARVDLNNLCLVGIAPNDTSQAFEDKHGRWPVFGGWERGGVSVMERN